MKPFIVKPEIRWSDLDPNFHVLHSKYYDFGAYSRMAFLVEHGFTAQVMQQLHIGPILFREECLFKKELNFGDSISINLEISKTTSNYARWSMRHEIYRNGDILAAIINIDGAWMDTEKRKLTAAPAMIAAIFEGAPKTADFQIIIK